MRSAWLLVTSPPADVNEGRVHKVHHVNDGIADYWNDYADVLWTLPGPVLWGREISDERYLVVADL
jgi:hypothetical protein